MRFDMTAVADERAEVETEGISVSSSSSSGFSEDKGMESDGCGVRGSGLSGVGGRRVKLAESDGWSNRPDMDPKLRECKSGISSASGAFAGVKVAVGPSAALAGGRRGDRGGIGGDVVGGEEGAN